MRKDKHAVKFTIAIARCKTSDDDLAELLGKTQATQFAEAKNQEWPEWGKENICGEDRIVAIEKDSEDAARYQLMNK